MPRLRLFECAVMIVMMLAVATQGRAQPVTGDLEISSMSVTPSSTTSGSNVSVGFTVRNLGPGRGQLTRYEVLVNGVVRASAQPLTVFSVPGNTASYAESVPMPTVPSGSTTSADVTVRITGAGDNNPTNNQRSRSVTVTGPARPDLTCNVPSNWSGSVVVSNVMGAVNSLSTIPAGSTVYVNVGYRNAGGTMASGGVQLQILLNGNVAFDAPYPPMSAGETRTRTNISLGVLPVGDYTVAAVLDGGQFVTESNEGNNSCSTTFSVATPPRPNLMPFTPSGWPSSLVLSRQPNTSTPAVPLRHGDTGYLDIGLANSGNASSGPFAIDVLLNGTSVTQQNHNGLSAGQSTALLDAVTLTDLPDGESSITVILDSQNAVAESSENDNASTLNIAVDPCRADFKGPKDITVSANENVVLSATAPTGSYWVTYRWRRNFTPLREGSGGASAGGGSVSGSAGSLSTPSTPTELVMTISSAQVSDAGSYDVEFVNICGSRISSPAVVQVTPSSCPGDANGDGRSDGSDLSVLLSQFGQTVPASSSADFNNDGIVNGADLSVLLAGFGQVC